MTLRPLELLVSISALDFAVRVLVFVRDWTPMRSCVRDWVLGPLEVWTALVVSTSASKKEGKEREGGLTSSQALRDQLDLR